MSAAHSAQPRSGPFVAPKTPRLVPGMGIVIHVGRRSRTVYRTPVLVFRTKDGYRIALTYGRDAEWVKNALAHGAVRLISMRRAHELSDPEIVTDPHGQHMPGPVRLF